MCGSERQAALPIHGRHVFQHVMRKSRASGETALARVESRLLGLDDIDRAALLHRASFDESAKIGLTNSLPCRAPRPRVPVGPA